MTQQATAPMTRRAGVLVHLSSLPGSAHCGDLGPGVVQFLDWCVLAGLRLWQLLPLGPPGLGHPPYTALSAFAGNPLWFSAATAEPTRAGDVADFAAATIQKEAQLEAAWIDFSAHATPAERAALRAFCEDSGQTWLADWALYAALKEQHNGLPWMSWETDLRKRKPEALRHAEQQLENRIQRHCFVQYRLDQQARNVRAACEARGILWVGDLPFYVALDSADVWAQRELFRVDADGTPAALSGFPPDDFSADGQLWNNPLFDWRAMEAQGYRWWLDRCRTSLRWVHALRLDHFRGYEAYWEVPAGATTAIGGQWLPGPGESLFNAVRDAGLGGVLIAEDLGEITPQVDALRERYALPGMHVLQFGLDDRSSTHHPERHRVHALACTGTHDNDTFEGWFASLDAAAQERVRAELATATRPARGAVDLCWRSPAAWAVAPLQDLLALGGAARMNRPGLADGQWRWRARETALTAQLAVELRALAERTRRL